MVGLIYAVLGFFTMQRSRVALGIAMALYLLDGVYAVAIAVQASGQPGIGGLIMRVLFLSLMWRGFQAIGDLKSRATQAAR